MSGRSPASKAALWIEWSPEARLTTGTGSLSRADAFKRLTRPVVVYVCDVARGCQGFDRLEAVILKNEKIALALKAFRTVKMSPYGAKHDPILAGHGKAVPRLLVVDPAGRRVTVLERSMLKVDALYRALQDVAGRNYREEIDVRVKLHLKLLSERDRLAEVEQALASEEKRCARIADRRGVVKAQRERGVVSKELLTLAESERVLWRLTPRVAQRASGAVPAGARVTVAGRR